MFEAQWLEECLHEFRFTTNQELTDNHACIIYLHKNDVAVTLDEFMHTANVLILLAE